MQALRKIGLILFAASPASAFAGIQATNIPEPGILSLFAVGGIALALYNRSRRK